MATPSRANAHALDEQDPLRAFKKEFLLPDGVIYLDGNSLGAPPHRAIDRLENTAKSEWGGNLIKSWNDAGWIDLPMSCGAKIARLIGVGAGDVAVCDSVSVNLFKLAAALVRRRRGALAFEDDEFPTDGYIFEGAAKALGVPLMRLEGGAPHNAFSSGASVIVKSAVHYKTAQIADIAQWEHAAQSAGACVIWDLSHATGLIALSLAEAGARFAVGCGYKFLNGGPGAPAFIYVKSCEARTLEQPLSGWMGHDRPFDFKSDYAPAPGVRRFLSGTAPVLSLSALDAALDVFDGVDMAALENKARALGDLFLSSISSANLDCVSPGLGARRGGHVALRSAHGFEIIQALIARGVIGDFRAPDLMRFGFSPLYISYADVWDAAEIFNSVIEKEQWRDPKFAERKTVT